MRLISILCWQGQLPLLLCCPRLVSSAPASWPLPVLLSSQIPSPEPGLVCSVGTTPHFSGWARWPPWQSCPLCLIYSGINHVRAMNHLTMWIRSEKWVTANVPEHLQKPGWGSAVIWLAFMPPKDMGNLRWVAERGTETLVKFWLSRSLLLSMAMVSTAAFLSLSGSGCVSGSM